MKIPNLRDSLCQGWGIFDCYHIRQNESGVLCLCGTTDQVCLGQNGIFWHPQVVWKFLEASLRLYELSRLAMVAKVRVW